MTHIRIATRRSPLALWQAEHVSAELQKLDPDGCSGHLSLILHLLEKNGSRQGYLRENWRTEKFKDIIERYELVVHK